MRLPAYGSYRDSDVEWLGLAPAHWNVQPLRALANPGRASFVDGDWIEAPYITDEGVRLLQTGNIGVGKYKEQGFRFVSERTFDALKCTEIAPGDILICRLAEPVGRACLAPNLGVRMITSVDVCILKPRPDLSAQFVVYALSSPDYLAFMEGQCRGGTRDRVARTFLGNVRLPVPPLAEQSTIAAFLDRETAKLDGLAAEQRQLIELLKEKRAAIVSQAVTKGLDPTSAIKNSGVEWLGDVPAHWRVTKLKHLVSLRSGGTPSKDNLGYWSGDIPWASAKDLKSDDLAETIDHITEIAIADGAAQLVPMGSVVVLVRGMMLARTFPVVRILAPMAINQDLKALNGREGVSNEYLAWLLRGTAPETLNRLDEAGHGTKALRMEAWLSMPVPLPPLAEQERIAAFIRTELGKLDALVTQAATAVTLLQERRSALISAAVTGRIDVRGLALAEAVAA